MDDYVKKCNRQNIQRQYFSELRQFDPEKISLKSSVGGNSCQLSLLHFLSNGYVK